MNQYKVRIAKVRKQYESAIKKLPKKRITIEGLTLNNRVYMYDISATEMDNLTNELSAYADRVLGDEWLYTDYVNDVYRTGTAIAYKNLARQSEDYARRSLNRLFLSEPFKRRESYVKNRVFEEMKKLNAQVKADMTRVLTDAMANGYGITKVSDQLMQAGIDNRARANRIARTEITTAYKRAHLDEADQAQMDYGIRTMQMQFSALSPTTRITHAKRHGKLYTTEEVREWMSIDANSINCKCTFITVVVDSNGVPVNTVLIERMKNMRVKK